MQLYCAAYSHSSTCYLTLKNGSDLLCIYIYIYTLRGCCIVTYQPLQLSSIKLIVQFPDLYCIVLAYASASQAASHNEAGPLAIAVNDFMATIVNEGQ